MVVMGNFNGKVGGESEGYKSCIGRHAMRDKTTTDRPCKSFAANGLVITGTLFQHKVTRQHGSWQMGE